MAIGRVLAQRDAYFEELFKIFKADRNCVLITADNGAPTLDKFAAEIPNQYITVGIAEQAMISMAAGMAHEGKRVWTYCIAPFATTRVHEFVKLDVAAMKLPITILGVGAGFAYDIMGPSHHTTDDISIMRACCGLEIYSPSDSVIAADLAAVSYNKLTPKYIRFDRAGIPNLYDGLPIQIDDGFVWHTPPIDGRDINGVIIATGIMVHRALEVAKRMESDGLNLAVADIFRVIPFPWERVFAKSYGMPLISLEEHFLSGGLGSIVSEKLHDTGSSNALLRLGVPDEYYFEPWGRDAAHQKYHLDVEGIRTRILGWL